MAQLKISLQNNSNFLKFENTRVVVLLELLEFQL